MATISSYQLKNGQTRWQVTGYAGVNPGTGKQINFHQRSFLTREAAKNWAKQKTAALIDQSAVNHSKGNMRIADWMHDWIQNYKLNVKEGSMIVYRYNIEKYIIPNVGNFTLTRYSPGQHQRFISDMLDHGGKGGAPLSFNSVQIINATLSNALKKAVQLEYISRNPAVGVEFPRSVKQVHPTLHYWTREQADRFLATAHEENDPVWYYFFLTILDLGLRKGEAMALKWSDVDFSTNTININKTRLYRAETGPNSGLVVLDDPKFPASFRTLYMTDRLRAALLEWNRTWYPRPKILSLDEDAPAHGGEDFVFRMHTAPRFYGKVLRDRSTNGAFERIRKATDLPKIVIHDLRHTLGVFMRESGVPLEDIRDVLGHKDISTTLIYAEVTPIVKKNATAKLNEYLVGDKQKKPTKRPGSANI